MSWSSVCELQDVLPSMGVCALVGERQIAIFRVQESVYAIDNYDPASRANVMSRGIVGDVKGERVVASPIFKHHYSLTTGRCLEDADKSVNVFPVRVMEGRIWVNPAVSGIEIYAPGQSAVADELPDSQTETLVLRDPRNGIYRSLLIRNNRLLGAVLRGDSRHGQWYYELMTAGEDIAALRDQLLFGPPAQDRDSAEASQQN